MTQRIPLDHLTSDQLDQLYQRLDHAETELRRYTEAESADAAAGSYAGRAEQAEAAIDRVRALHTRVLRMEALVCAHCGHVWPCDTIRALDDTQLTPAVAKPGADGHCPRCPHPVSYTHLRAPRDMRRSRMPSSA